MKNIIRNIVAIRSRVYAKDIVAIYACALLDVALVAGLIGLIVYFV